jgi:hypothetical protein
MYLGKSLKFAAIAIAVLALTQFAKAQTTGDGKIANMSVGAGSVRWDIQVPNAGGAVTIQFPDGRSVRKAFRAGGAAEFDLTDKQLDSLPDGVYNYELRLAPILAAGQKDIIMKARGEDDESETQRNLRKRPAMPALTQSGTFAIVNGVLIGPGAIESQRTGANSAQPKPPVKTAAPARVSENTISRLRNHRFSLMPAFDIVDADDVIIQGSLCVGLDCVNNESFGFDTIRLKENNTRIKFDDTSTSAGFPNNDWQLTANDSASGGANKFSIEDITGSKVPFTITAGAPTNSLFVSSAGKIGNGTSSPVLNFHIAATDTPAIRQEQTNGGGFTAQTWDIGANEANWFVRDVTGGSRLPLRIRPGAPTSSIDISASGNVGVGTASPAARLDVTGGDARMSSAGSKISWATTDTSVERMLLFSTTYGFGIDATDLVVHSGAGGGTTFKNDSVSGTSLMRITGAGNVGINTTSPDERLSVNGDADKVGGGSWLNFSDERLKTIKGQFNRGLSAVMRLTPIRYEYLKNNALGLTSDGEHVGFGAQSLQKVIPEAVVKNSEGYLMVNNDPVLWAMLNAIKEQQKEIEQLKSQIQKLRKPARHGSNKMSR